MYQRASPCTDLPDICYEEIYENLPTKFKFGSHRPNTSGTLQGDLSECYCRRQHYTAVDALSSSEMVSGSQDSRTGVNITLCVYTACTVKLHHEARKLPPFNPTPNKVNPVTTPRQIFLRFIFNVLCFQQKQK
jgi:hypothetical protein